MLERLKYKNHINEIIDFGIDGIFVDTNELHDYEWSVSERNNKIAGFSRGIKKRSFPVVILCDSESNGIIARNRLFEVVEKDVLAQQPGRIIIGDYYYECFISKSKKSDYSRQKQLMQVTLTTVSDKPYWVKETSFFFSPVQVGGSGFLDFPYDYPYDFSNSNASQEINNGGFVNTNFRIRIYGAVTNPSVTIGGHIYQVNSVVDSGEYLTIDSATKKIYLTAENGQQTNEFSKRNKNSYIFEKIKPGINTVTWDGAFNFEIVVLEERSEPKWT